MQRGFFPPQAQQGGRGGLSTQAHLEFLIANSFDQRHPQQLASVKLWRLFGNDKPFLLSLRAASSAYKWLVGGSLASRIVPSELGCVTHHSR